MARPEQVDHGYLYGKTVLVYPERVDCDFYRRTSQHFSGKSCALTDHEIQAEMVRHAGDHGGYKSGDIAKVTMVSRFGDCGITKNLYKNYGYDLRLPPECLEEIDETTKYIIGGFLVHRDNIPMWIMAWRGGMGVTLTADSNEAEVFTGSRAFGVRDQMQHSHDDPTNPFYARYVLEIVK